MDDLTGANPALVRQSSADGAALYIRRLIFDGTLRPGQRIPQDEIARALGVSRIPIREALIALERGGWVVVELHRGAFVSALDELAVRDHYELYGLVYGFAAQRALERSGPELGSDLVAAADLLAVLEDPEEFNRVALQFQSLITTAACSPRIKVVLRAMSGLVPGNFFALVPGAMQVERRGLAAIAQAMHRGDGTAAAAEYSAMMREQGGNVVAVFTERGLLGSGGATDIAVVVEV